MGVIFFPSQGISLVQVPGCADQAIFEAVCRAKPESREFRQDARPGSRIFCVIRNPLERFQEWHRQHWIENRSFLLPEALRKVGFQREWAASQVAEHAAVLALASRDAPGLIPLGGYTPQSQFWPEDRPEFLLYDALPYEWERKIGVQPMPDVSERKYKFAAAAIVGDIKSTLERAYATDMAAYSLAKQFADEELDRLRRFVSPRALR